MICGRRIFFRLLGVAGLTISSLDKMIWFYPLAVRPH
jgi:hypothetical protein